jgi:hypothetical protein
MYMREPGEEAPRMEIATGEAVVLGICGFAVLFLGIFPNQGSLPILDIDVPVIDWARRSVEVLFH